jgi:hypothetical protein
MTVYYEVLIAMNTWLKILLRVDVTHEWSQIQFTLFDFVVLKNTAKGLLPIQKENRIDPTIVFLRSTTQHKSQKNWNEQPSALSKLNTYWLLHWTSFFLLPNPKTLNVNTLRWCQKYIFIVNSNALLVAWKKSYKGISVPNLHNTILFLQKGPNSIN